ncbi:MAG: ribosome maturation factor RimP [Clostridiales bacterium]|nr:ribosome maturation factor RimP [Clostridiales bacterium]
MSKREAYEKLTEDIVTPIIKANNYELVDVEYVKEAGNYYLRVYVDKEGGIAVDDCEIVSRALSEILDEKDFVEDSYILEVSSPGLGRPLKKDKDFARSIGMEVELHLFKPINKQKQYSGVLSGYTDKTVTIDIEENDQIVIERKDIALIRLAFDF